MSRKQQKPERFLCNLKELYSAISQHPKNKSGFQSLQFYAKSGVFLLGQRELTQFVFLMFTRI